MRAILLVDHGSRRSAANESLERVAELVRERAPELIVCAAHMELAPPDIAEGFARCVAQGAREVVVQPFMLSAGRHATEDIPRLAASAAGDHPGVTWKVAAPLGVHALLAELVLVRSGEV